MPISSKTPPVRADDPARDRLLALVKSDAELSRRFADQVALDRDENRALSNLLGHAHLTAEKDVKAERLLDLQRLALREPERQQHHPRPVVTPRSAAWLVGQIGDLLPTEPQLAASLAARQLELEAEGHERGDAVAHVARELLRMAADEQPPLNGNSELARVIRICAQKILVGQWREERDPGDVQREQAERATLFHSDRLEEIHQTATVLRAPARGVRIVDTRELS